MPYKILNVLESVSSFLFGNNNNNYLIIIVTIANTIF